MALDLLTTLTRLQPQFVLLDAAQGPEVFRFLAEHTPGYQCLFDGQKAFDLAPYAPYLAPVPDLGTSLTWWQAFVRNGWGRSWAVFMSSSAPLMEVRAHWQQFLYVQDSAGKQLYFRFYDPRVLRTFLPTYSTEQLQIFFGPVTQFVSEGNNPSELVRFMLEDQKLSMTTAAVTTTSVEG